VLTTEDDDRRLSKQKGRPGIGGLFFLGRIVPTGQKIRQNFLAKSYEPKKGGVKGFLGNKYLCIQQLRK
jgi:hypothetical protein